MTLCEGEGADGLCECAGDCEGTEPCMRVR